MSHRVSARSDGDDCGRFGSTAMLIKQELNKFERHLNDQVSAGLRGIVDEVAKQGVCRSCASNSPELKQNDGKPVESTSNDSTTHPVTVPEHTGQHHKRHHHHVTPRKVFKPRPSLLTTLFEGRHANAIYSSLVGVLVLYMVFSVLLELVENRRLSLRLDMIWWCFSDLHIAFTIWLGMFLSNLAAFQFYQFWGTIERMPTSAERYLLLSLYVCYTVVHIYWPIRAAFYYDLPPACSYIVNCEQIRLFMKIHSFVRECYGRTLKWKATVCHREDVADAIELPHDVTSVVSCPAFEKYWYFVWAPTLLYRDEYPRTAKTDWNLVVRHLIQGLGCIVCSSYIMTYCVQYRIQHFGPEHATLAHGIAWTLECAVAGSALTLLLFWGLVHSWANMWCELMRFADRHYYNDWWNSKRMASYYRDWNLVVHEWLYEYIMRDVAGYVKGARGKVAGTLAVFFVSAFFHEYSFITGFRLFCPAMFLLYFMCGPMLFFVSRLLRMDRAWNIMMFAMLSFGNGLFLALYSREWYARINCEPVYEGIWNYVIPLSWSCEKLKL